jgi:hypothetical protein
VGIRNHQIGGIFWLRLNDESWLLVILWIFTKTLTDLTSIYNGGYTRYVTNDVGGQLDGYEIVSASPLPFEWE